MRRWIVVVVVFVGIAAVLVGVGTMRYLGWGPFHKTEGQTKLAPFLKRLKADDPQVRADAITEISRLDVATAVPALVEVLAIPDEDMRLQAAMALGEIGAPAVPALEKALADQDAVVRFYAVWALGLAGPAAKAATPAVIAKLHDANADVRYKAAFTLGRIGGESDDAVVALIGAIQDSDQAVAGAATEGLVRLGPHAAGPLRQALAQPGLGVAAARTLSQMAAAKDDDASQAGIRAAADVLRAFDGRARGEQDGLLIYFGELGSKGLPAVRETLKGKDAVLAARCAVALRVIARHAEDRGEAANVTQTVELLIGMLSNDDARARTAAVEALGTVRTAADTTGPALQKALLDETYAVSRAAMLALNRQDPVAQARLRKRITAAAGDEKLRLACLIPARHRALLEENLQHADAGLRLRIACALATDASEMPRPEEFCKQLVPIFAEALKAANAARRRDAAEGLRKIARLGGPTVIPVLQAALTDTDPDVSTLAAQGLAQAGKS
jgi:HEAT repeat protein